MLITEKQDQAGLVDELKRQLREKDLVLTDIRLEALSSAHQLESLKDTVIKMRVRILHLDISSYSNPVLSFLLYVNLFMI